jgi:hypothetical protein
VVLMKGFCLYGMDDGFDGIAPVRDKRRRDVCRVQGFVPRVFKGKEDDVHWELEG